LDAPTLRQRTGVDHVEPESVDQFCYLRLCDEVVPGDRQSSPVSRARWRSVAGDLTSVDVIERLHHVSARQPGLQQLGAGRSVIVEGCDVSIAPCVVIVGVDDCLAYQGLGRDVADRLQRDRYDHKITGRGRFLGRSGTASWAHLGHELGQRLRSS